MVRAKTTGGKHRVNVWATVVANSPREAEQKVFDLLFGQEWVFSVRSEILPEKVKPVHKKITDADTK
jgi:hypothetical protein